MLSSMISSLQRGQRVRRKMHPRARFDSFLSVRSSSDRPLYDQRYSISRINDRTSRVERQRGEEGLGKDRGK